MEAERDKEIADQRTTKQSYQVQWTTEDYNRKRYSQKKVRL